MIANENTATTVLVTGAAGFLGTHIASALARDHHVIGLDVKEPADLPPGAEWIACDLTGDAGTRAALTEVRKRCGGRLASAVHLAAYYDFSGEPSDMYDKLTVQGTHRLIEGLKEFERVEQVIFSSSLLVMKPAEGDSERLSEQSPTRAAWAYPQSKLAAEQVLRQEHGALPTVVLRLAGVYDDMGHSLPIGQQIHRIYEKTKESYVFPGDAENGQPFIHVDDVAACVRRTVAVRNQLDGWELLLIAEPEVMSYRELQDMIGRELHGEAWPAVRIPKAVAKAGAWAEEKLDADPFIKPWMIDLADDNYPVSIKRAQERLGWAPQHRLRAELPHILAALKRDPRHWFEVNNLPQPEELVGSGRS
ncbi:MAG TPA: NAD(P)-dependent oxidoreductase [Phycisphaerae bacterium]|nr:NAD(P)-dependent oxidoreductase [Phycisphaerae bacterium]